MYLGFIIAGISLFIFALLGVYDGFYLHLVKYRLYGHKESKFEHFIHTARTLLFPLILYFLFLGQNEVSLYLGILFVVLDIIALGVDAYSEEDSRAFMGGLPRGEYILHLFVNGFHFATIAVFLVLKIRITEQEWYLLNNFENVASYGLFIGLVKNLIPGAILIALLHVLLNFKKPKKSWNRLLNRFQKQPLKKSTL